MSGIDNICTKTIKEGIFSGNIMIEIADHLLQFISINKNEVKHIKPNYYKRDNKMLKNFWQIFQLMTGKIT